MVQLALLIAVSLVGLGWLAQLALVLRTARSVPPVPPATAAPERWPTLSLIVPARDEGSHVEAALRSKLASGYPALEVVAVDDRSTDGTRAAMDRVAAADPRVTVVSVDALPAGWLGKLNAMARGVERAHGEWVLFSDADVHLAAGALQRIVAYAETERADLVAIAPRMEPVSPLVDAGVVTFLRSILLSCRMWRANDDRRRFAMGIGAFNLVRRSALDETSALERLHMEVADDVALAMVLKGAGKRCRVLVGRGDVFLTFLPTLGAAARSADKAGGLLGFSCWKPVAAAALSLGLDLAVPLGALGVPGPVRWVALGVLGVITATHLALAHHFEAPPRGALLWPLGVFLQAVLIARAGVSAWHRGGIVWRGTFYPEAALEAGRVLDLASMRLRTPGR